MLGLPRQFNRHPLGRTAGVLLKRGAEWAARLSPVSDQVERNGAGAQEFDRHVGALTLKSHRILKAERGLIVAGRFAFGRNY